MNSQYTSSNRKRVRAKTSTQSQLICLSLFFVCSFSKAAPSDTDALFDEHSIELDTATYQTVLTGFFSDGEVSDLLVVNSVDEAHQLQVMSADAGVWTQQADINLPADVLFIDVAAVAGQDRLLAYRFGGVDWIDVNSGQRHELISVRSHLVPPPGNTIQHVDISHDVNGDGLDDLVIPDSDGFQVHVQLATGQFDKPVTVGPAQDLSGLYRIDGYRHDPFSRSRIHRADMNHDGRIDLVSWQGNHLVVHHQTETGGFDATSQRYPTDVKIDSDDMRSLAAPAEIRERRHDQQLSGALLGRVLHSVRDMNGDGIADLLVFSLTSGELVKMRSSAEVYFGTLTADGGTGWPSTASTATSARGLVFEFSVHDINHDGRQDLAYATFKPRPFRILGAFVRRAIAVDMEFHLMQADDRYPDRYNTRRVSRAYGYGAPGEKNARFPYLSLIDLDQDNHDELILIRSAHALAVYSGLAGDDVFRRRAQFLDIDAPADEETLWQVDLNRDGKLDLLMHYPSSDQPSHVRLLISN